MSKSQDSPDAKTRLLEAAATLFSEKGFAGVSVRAICDAAGTGNNMVHHYFGSKRGLQDAIVSQFSTEVFSVPIRIMTKLPNTKSELTSRFELFVEETLEALIAHRPIFMMIMQEKLIPNDSPFIAYSQHFIAFLEHGKKQGFVNDAIEPSMLTGLVLDRLSNQVLYASVIKQQSGDDIIDDPDYRSRWLRANIDLFLYGFTA